MGVEIKFLGAADTVTGSKYLISSGSTQILVDAGMFQGERRWREENWREPPCDLSRISAVLITHAHIDHTGILPRYYALGLKAPIFATRATMLLSQLMLLDAANIQEEDAQYREQDSSRSRHHPPLPLYTRNDAKGVLELFKVAPFGQRVEIAPNVFATWRHMGHILGAASITLEIGGKRIVFSGDIGRYQVPILKDPEPTEFGDLLLIESTYGDRTHPAESPEEKLAEIVTRTIKRGGVVVIPSFAVGRAQLLLYYLRALKQEKRIPDMPVIIDSPMADDATQLYIQSPGDYDEQALGLLKKGVNPFSVPKLGFVKDRSESIRLNSVAAPMVLISASGMLSGGRILHHLKHRISEPKNTILFVGHQPVGGRGDWILKGAESLRLFGQEIPIRAEITSISGLSAHADRDEMLRWCSESKGTPGKVAVVHGEPETAKTFAQTLRDKYSWDVSIPTYLSALKI